MNGEGEGGDLGLRGGKRGCEVIRMLFKIERNNVDALVVVDMEVPG